MIELITTDKLDGACRKNGAYEKYVKQSILKIFKGTAVALFVESLYCKQQGLPAHYGPGFDSDSNRNFDQESCWRIKRGWRVRLTNSTPSEIHLPRKFCIIGATQP